MKPIKNIRFQLFVSIICIVFGFICGDLHAQYDNYWAWGPHRGLDFRYQKPNAVKADAQFSYYSSICDSAGNLLFYADSDSILDKNNNPFHNQCNINTQNMEKGFVMILPKNNHEYFLIYTTFNYTNNFPNIFVADSLGLFYALIDMRLNHGLGDIEKGKAHVKIYNGLFMGIAAARKTGGGYWLLTKSSDTLYSFPADSLGIGSPTKSVLPELPNGSYSPNYTINPSNDNNFVVTTCIGSEINGNNTFSSIYGYQFDVKSGKFSYQALIDYVASKGINNRNYINQYYSCAFSPNDSLMYVSSHPYGGKNTDTFPEIIQYARYANNIAKSGTVILHDYMHSANNFSLVRDVKLAPDGRVYFVNSGNSRLGYIPRPDIRGQGCGAIYDGPYCKCQYNGFENCLGLPFQKNIPLYKKIKYRARHQCGYIHFSSESDSIFKCFTWYKTDINGKLIDSLIAGPEVDLFFPKSGRYIITMQGMSKPGYKKWYTDTIKYLAPPKSAIYLKNDSFCEHNPIRFYDASITDSVNISKPASWHWDFGDGDSSNLPNPTHIYDKNGLFLVSLKYNNGFCADITSKKITILAAPKATFSVVPKEGCAPLVTTISGTNQDPNIKNIFDFGNGQTDSSLVSHVNYQSAGHYKIWHSIFTNSGCVVKDSFILHVMPSVAQSVSDISNVTVDSGKVKIFWTACSAAASYSLYRSQDSVIGWNRIAVLDTSYYLDKDVDVTRHSYTYKCVAIDSCGSFSRMGRVGSTILLSGLNINNFQANLNWNPYRSWENGIKAYVLLAMEDTSGFRPITSLSSGLNVFEDLGYFSGNSKGKTYRVDALSNDPQNYRSSSNELFLGQVPHIYIPNAFSPDKNGINDNFLPVLTGIKNYTLKIYNRWGEQVFESASIIDRGIYPGTTHGGNSGNQGWDGRFHNVPSSEGIYYFMIAAEGFDHQKIYQSGNIQLIK